ncbi:hypothetical protein KCU91_g4931, partial [Aureobasidium melanogenum]
MSRTLLAQLRHEISVLKQSNQEHVYSIAALENENDEQKTTIHECMKSDEQKRKTINEQNTQIRKLEKRIAQMKGSKRIQEEILALKAKHAEAGVETDKELRVASQNLVFRNRLQQERLLLLNHLADTLHSQVDSPPPASDELSLVSTTSTAVTSDSEKTSRPTSSIFSSSLTSSITSPVRSVSSIFSLPFGSSSRLSVAGSGPVPHTPIVFNSP